MRTINKQLTNKEAVKLAKLLFLEEHNRTRLPRNYTIAILSRYGGGKYVLITGAGLTTEFYYNYLLS